MSRRPYLIRRRPYLIRISVVFAALASPVVLMGASPPASTHPGSGAGNANAVGQPAPTVTFGISDPALASETATAQVTDIAGMKAAGLTSLRIEANWSWVQPS